MRFVVVTVLGVPPPGEDRPRALEVHTSARAGGRCTAFHILGENDSPEGVAVGIAAAFNDPRWFPSGCYFAQAAGSAVTVVLQDAVSDVTVVVQPGQESYLQVGGLPGMP